MSNNNNNNFVRADGSVNCDNPRVCAAMIDGVGTLLCGVMHDLKSNAQLLDMMDDKTKTDLDCIFSTLQMVRNSIGVDTDWYNENQQMLVGEIYAEASRVRKMRQDAIVKSMLDAGLPMELLPPEMRPKPDAATTADALLEQLRSEGVIG
jgi:hypothetical protein